MKKNKILIVGNYYHEKGGISALIRNLYFGLSNENIKVKIYSVGGSSIINRSFKYFKLPICILKSNIIHLHGCSSFGLLPVIIGYLIASFFRKKTIITYHGSVENVNKVANNIFFKKIINRNTLITTPSKNNSEVFRSLGFKSVFIPNIFDIQNWPYKKRELISPTFICTRSRYNPKIVIDTFLKINESFPNAKLKMLGNFNDLGAFAKASKYQNIELIEELPRNKVLMELNSCDIYINSCNNDSFGYSIYEAISCGLIVVSVNSPSLLDNLGDNIILFSDDDKLSNIISYILNNQAEAQQRIKKGLESINALSWNFLKNKWFVAYFKN